MNAFPDLVLVPTTSNRLRVTENNERFIQKLLVLEVDAASFLMPEKELPASNNAEIAKDDLFGQLAKLPPAIHAKIFPPPPVVVPPAPPVKPAESEEDDDDGGGMGAGMGMSMSPGKSLEEAERQRRQREEEEEEQQHKQGPGYGMSM
jgi:hypothetical protein